MALSAGLLFGCAPAAPVTSRVPAGVVPAVLRVSAPDGAEIHLDGVPVGTAPLGSDVLADPGPHEVGIALDGHVPSVTRVTLERGKTRKLEVDLETTSQRKAAWTLVAVGGAGVVTGIVLGALAVVEQRKADDMVRGPDAGALDPERFREYTEIRDAYDRYRIGSGVAAGAGVVTFVTGALLYGFDEAVLPSRAREGAGLRLTPLLPSAGLGLVPSYFSQW